MRRRLLCTAQSRFRRARTANSEDAAQRGLDEFFATRTTMMRRKMRPAGEAKGGRASYAPDPIGLSNASGTAVDDRTVMAPEADGERGSLPGGRPTAPPSGQPTPPPIGLVDRDQNTAANVGAVPGQPHDLAGRPAAESPGKPTPGGQSNAVYGISDHAGSVAKRPRDGCHKTRRGLAVEPETGTWPTRRT